MKPLSFRCQPRLLAILAAAASLLTLPAHAQLASGGASIGQTVGELGRVNGIALACGHKELVARAKSVMLARVAKTRALGERYETATSEAFTKQGTDTANCPGREVLAIELESVAMRLAPPTSHSVSDETETRTPGFNPRYLLQAGNGRAVMDSDFHGKYQLITFGYTFCPDVCPTTLNEVAAILKRLGDKADKLQAIFISVDPERDSLPALRTYVGFFDSRILAATGSKDLIKHAADNFKVRFEKVVEPGADPKNYAMDHTAGIYLLGPRGHLLARFVYATPVDDMVKRIEEEMKLRDAAPVAAETPAPR